MPRDVITIGRSGIDLYSLDYDTPLKDVKRFAKYVGGGAANLSIGLARLGLKVSIVSGVADDDLGEYIIEFLAHEKIDTTNIIKTKNGKTGVVFAEVFPGRESKFIFYRENAADLLITKEDIDKARVSESRMVVTTGTGFSANPSREANLYAMELGMKSGKEVVFNLDWRPSLWKDIDPSSRLDYYSQGIELATILVGNESEYAAATGKASAEEAISLLSGHGKVLILTRGENGTRAHMPDGKIIDAAPFKVQVLKTLGAGDGNLAGILYGLLNGWDMHRTLRLGSAIGAIVVTKHSCSDAMPTLDETMGFIAKNGGF